MWPRSITLAIFFRYVEKSINATIRFLMKGKEVLTSSPLSIVVSIVSNCESIFYFLFFIFFGIVYYYIKFIKKYRYTYINFMFILKLEYTNNY